MELSNQSTPQSRSPRLLGSACDSCRRRRVRCSGTQPCERCVKSGVSCTFGSSTNRSALTYTRYLENKVADLQQRLRQRSRSDSEEQEVPVSQMQEGPREQLVDMLVGPRNDYVHRMPQSSSNVFYGRFAGLSILRNLGDVSPRYPSATPFVSPGREFVEAFEKQNPVKSVGIWTGLNAVLPSKSRVQELVDRANRTALICHDCLDYLRFPQQLDRLYDIDPEEYASGDREFLTLVYALLALGRRYQPHNAEDEIGETETRVKLQGLGYFNASSDVLNELDDYGLDSVRATICQARFLLSASMMSKAYSKVCIGIGAALRMGLHVSSAAVRLSFSSDELSQRRRVFATLNMMDTYFSSLLGMPKVLRDADLEQTLGLQEKDLADEGHDFVSRNADPPAVETVVCQQLNNILARILEDRYAMRRVSPDAPDGTYDEDFDSVTAREAEIQEWHSKLLGLPEADTDIRALQGQLTLLLWHSLAQVVLYRPFLHHLARDLHDAKFNMRGYECASACVRAAMQAVWVIEAFKTHDVLHEGYWLNMYMLGFAASILTFFVTCSSQRTTLVESTSAARKANDLLGLLAKYNVSARRCHTSLSAVMKTLPVTDVIA